MAHNILELSLISKKILKSCIIWGSRYCPTITDTSACIFLQCLMGMVVPKSEWCVCFALKVHYILMYAAWHQNYTSCSQEEKESFLPPPCTSHPHPTFHLNFIGIGGKIRIPYKRKNIDHLMFGCLDLMMEAWGNGAELFPAFQCWSPLFETFLPARLQEQLG